MCRLFVFCGTGTHSKSDLFSNLNPLVDSWRKATERDETFLKYRNVSCHDDGYGTFQYFKTENNKEHISVNKSSIPAFRENHTVNLEYDTIDDFVGLFHARKASPGMPLKLAQNHPLIDENGAMIVAHNGTIDKNIVFSLLDTKPKNIDHLSDTQLFFLLAKQVFDSKSSTDKKNLFEEWKLLISKLKALHIAQNLRYSMNIILLLKDVQNDIFDLFYSSLYSDPRGKDYFDFYVARNDNNFLICSSTIMDFFEKDYPTNKTSWKIETLPNNAIGLVNLQSFNKFELTLA